MSESTLLLAERVVAELERQGLVPLLIGAAAMAAHGYARFTEDLDLALAMPTTEMPPLFESLRVAGFHGHYSAADGADPLGGVITLEAEHSRPVQIINFDNSPAGGFPALVRAAEQRATGQVGLPGRLVGVEDLVLFKLYAGGAKSKLDIVELLTRVPVDLALLRERAAGFRLDRALERVLALLDDP